PFRQIFLEAGEHLIELAEHIHGERVGARARLVEREPGDALFVVREPPVAPGRGRAGALGLGERPQLEIARRERVPDYAHLAASHWCWMHDCAAHSVRSLPRLRGRAWEGGCNKIVATM